MKNRISKKITKRDKIASLIREGVLKSKKYDFLLEVDGVDNVIKEDLEKIASFVESGAWGGFVFIDRKIRLWVVSDFVGNEILI